MKELPETWSFSTKEDLRSLYDLIREGNPRHIINIEKEPKFGRSRIHLYLKPVGFPVNPREVNVLRGAAYDILKGLEWLHDRGFVHRDLRWANVIMTRNGRVVIIDLEHSGKEGEVEYVLESWPNLRGGRYVKEMDLILMARMIHQYDALMTQDKDGGVCGRKFVAKLEMGVTQVVAALGDPWLSLERSYTPVC